MGLRYTEEAQAFLRIVAPGPRKAVRKALDLIRADAMHKDLDWRRLRKEGPDRFMRARVGDYRIVYSPRKNATYIWRIQHRREGYNWLERFDPPRL